MANRNPNTKGLIPWKPGQSGNPSGRTRMQPISDRYAHIAEEKLPAIFRLASVRPRHLFVESGPIRVLFLAMRKEAKQHSCGRGIKMNSFKSLIFLILVSAGALVICLHLGANNPQPQTNPILINTCLITTNVSRLVNFYENVLGMKAQWSGEQYAEFHTGVGVLAIFSAEAQEKYIPGSSQAASNRSAILQFKVADVDHEHVRLQPLVTIWVKKPTTQPWGTRSVYFRDPDGNLVDFYLPAKID